MESVLLWDESKVCKWLSSVGHDAYEKQIKEHGVTGDVLIHLDHDTLKDLSVTSVGERLDILRHIYNLKTMWRIPLNEWDYVPPSALYENDWLGQNGMADYRKIETAFQERDNHLRQLTDDLTRLSTEVARLRDELAYGHKGKDKKGLGAYDNDKKIYASSSSSSGGGRLLTPPAIGYATADYFSTYHPRSTGNDTPSTDLRPTPSVTINDGGAIKVYGEKIANNSKVDLEASKNVRLLLDDPCSKVITSALKKYNVMDDWQQYALWIQFGSPDNLQERALGYDERPLRISQKLKDAKQNPVFVLKHVKDGKVFNPEKNGHAFISPRPAPRPNKESDWKKGEGGEPKTAITSGRVGYEVVVPVMSSSISTPTPTTSTITTTLTPSSSSSNSNSNSNSNSSSNNNNNVTLNNSTSTSSNSNSNNTPTPASAKRAGTINKNPSENFLSELGLESGIANAIYTIMMDDSHDTK